MLTIKKSSRDIAIGGPKFLLAAVLTLLLMAGAVVDAASDATATAEHLDRLFEELQQTQSRDRARELTDEIWMQWHQVSDLDVRQHFERGLKHMSNGELKAAITAFDDVIETAPDFPEGWNKRATVYFQLGNYDRSADDVKETLKREPRHFGALSGLGLLYLAMERPKAALKAFEEALAVNPHLPGPKQNIKYIQQILELHEDNERKKAI